MTGTRAATRIHSFLRGDSQLTIYFRGTHSRPTGTPGYPPTDWPGHTWAAYQVKLLDGQLIYAPKDSGHFIRVACVDLEICEPPRAPPPLATTTKVRGGQTPCHHALALP